MLLFNQKKFDSVPDHFRNGTLRFVCFFLKLVISLSIYPESDYIFLVPFLCCILFHAVRPFFIVVLQVFFIWFTFVLLLK